MKNIVWKTAGIAVFTLILFAPVSFNNTTSGLTVANAASNPCGSAYIVTGPDQNGNYTCTQGSTSIVVNAQGQPTGGETTPTGAQPGTDESTTCTESVFSWGSFFNSSCWGPLLSATIAGALVYVSSWVLTISGVLFNWVLYETVLQFGQLINCGTSAGVCNNGIITGINTAWGVFRDLSNIVIIGMFTFIAIATILGITEYGYKKMLSRVLIVAVLINFSLLFAKIIIDASNFTASQFYAAASANNPDLQDNNPAGGAQNTPTAQQAGVAGAFMKYAGVQGFGDAAKGVFNISKNPQGGAWWGLLFGVITSLMFLVAAIVLFYGSFLLISRAILMIFLMVTSSIAFATYLVPSLSSGGYGFSAWWQTLLKNAVFAPLLMLLLWVTLKIGFAFQANGATLGKAISDPTNPLYMSALFGYIIVIGLLFAAFKVSSSFSTSVGGFNYASMVPRSLLSTAGAAASRTGGFLGRNSVGRGAQVAFNAAQKRGVGKSALGRTLMSNLNALQTSSFDALNNKNLRKRLGSGMTFGTEVGKGGIVGVQKRQAEAAVKRAEMANQTSDQQKGARKAAQENVETTQAGARKEIADVRKTMEEEVKKAREGAEADTNTMKDTEKGGIREKETAIREAQARKAAAESEQRVAEQEEANASTDSGKTQARERATAARNRMLQEDQRIKDAQAGINDHNDKLKELDAQMDKARQAAEEAIRAKPEYARLADREKELDKAKADAIKSATIETRELAQQIAHNRPGTLYGVLGSVENDPVSKRVSDVMRSKKHKANAKQIIEAMNEEKPEAPAAGGGEAH